MDHPPPDHRYLNIIDVESTCWDGPTPAGETSEIIEIGLCTVDLERRERVGRDRVLVRPAHSRVSPFCTELTGLTADEVAAGVPFAEACESLRAEHGSNARAWASWGAYDRRMFDRRCRATGVPYPFGPWHVNAKAVHREACGLPREVGMKRALHLAGLPLEGRHHSGADDAWNIAALVLDLVGRGMWPTSQ